MAAACCLHPNPKNEIQILQNTDEEYRLEIFVTNRKEF